MVNLSNPPPGSSIFASVSKLPFLDALTYVPKPFRYALYAGGLVVGGVSVLLYKYQDRMLYFPEIGGLGRSNSSNPRGYRSPEEHDLPFEDHLIPTGDGTKVHSWMLLRDKKSMHLDVVKHPTIIFFHGNAGNIGMRLPNAADMVHKLNVNVLLVEYRGFGESFDNIRNDGRPDEAGLKKDAEAALDFARSHPAVDSKRIFVFGRSLGGAVGFHLALHAERQAHGNPLAGLIVENTFTSIPDMVDAIMPAVAPLKSLVLRMKWDNAHVASNLQETPVLFVAGEHDELVPHKQMKALYDALNQNKKRKHGRRGPLTEMVIIPKGTHNDTWLRGGNLYWTKFKNFINQVNVPPSVAVSATCTDSELEGIKIQSGNSDAAAHSIPIVPGN
eukprot:CAMPEP_0113320826 /NCGR_PEP_ID=MMETSP0010_2-20120614/14517_1 /TAXON_ID=216773 ORGANISM="Corethron hystrix, Strain 308" /NCGR_SAMPLE_ID=MMETSP0010_2 /ASSEMBLY_ACC=CAM_ASM_000155 /LENGTH=386 /DNA_ID=CAMNT_0000178761 /DNA_START=87 /DNA_END=1244 /DNA_ORIENTATION=- /assembly_acc=CAM_ASM_000155